MPSQNKTPIILTIAFASVWAVLAVTECVSAVRGPEGLYEFELSCRSELFEKLAAGSILAKTIYGTEAELQQTRQGSWGLSTANDSGRRAVRYFRVMNAGDMELAVANSQFHLRLKSPSQTIDVELYPRQAGKDVLLEPRPNECHFSILPKYSDCITYRGDLSIILESMIEGWRKAFVMTAILLSVLTGWKYSGFVA